MWIDRSVIVGLLPLIGFSGSYPNAQGLEARGERIVDQQPSGEALPDAEDFLEYLGRLQRADHADDGAEHADLGAVGHRARRRRLGKQAA